MPKNLPGYHMLENILNGMNAYLYVSDAQTDEILFINDKMREHFGLDEQTVGQVCWQVLQEGFSGRCSFCPNYKLAQDPESTVVWEEHNTVTGRYYQNSDRLIEWSDGRLVHMQHSQDITELKQAEAALKKRLQQQGLMADISQLFIGSADVDDTINQALQMTGEFLDISRVLLVKYDQQALHYQYEWYNSYGHVRSKSGETLALAESDAQVAAAFASRAITYYNLDDSGREAIIDHYGLDITTCLFLPIYTGDSFWGVLEFDQCESYSPWTDSDINLGEMVAAILSGVISRRNREDQLLSNLIEAKETAEQASQAKGDFLSRMSHEIRTPMNAIIGMTDIALSTRDVDKKEYCLHKIDGASKHLLNVINDILDMSKIEANKFELSLDEFDFERSLMDIIGVVNFRAEEKKQDLIINIAPQVPRALIGDELRIGQVITNLLTNAIKFTPEGGIIKLNVNQIATEDEFITLQLEVIDNGIGISAEQQSRLFTSFEQADGGIARKYGGTGLGLAICKHIVGLMGGRIWVESVINQGSTFTFTMQVQKGKKQLERGLAGSISRGDIRILAVDDSPETREYFQQIMAALELHCDVAASGEEALAMIEQSGATPYNIFFVDWQMPNMNGIELTKKIKSITADSAVIIMISIAAWGDIEQDALAAGVNHFVSKPLFPSTLINGINECLGVMPMDKAAAKRTVLSGGYNFKNYHLLLAEDVEINREIIQTLLEDTQISIDFAENGRQALNMFANDPAKYNLILMDIHMPEMEGYEATRLIRALPDEKAHKVPIIAMTANVFREDIEACLAAGMNDHIGKPVDVKQLFNTLTKYLKPASIPSAVKKDGSYKPITHNLKQDVDSAAAYAAFLPIIDVAGGLSRVMNNKKLYFTLLHNFSGQRMAGELAEHIRNNNFSKTAQAAHAIKGVAANLGLNNLLTVVSNIEEQAKMEMGSIPLLGELNKATEGAISSIQLLLEGEGIQ